MSSTFTVLKKALRIWITSLIHPYFHVHFGVKVSRAESELNLELVSPSSSERSTENPLSPAAADQSDELRGWIEQDSGTASKFSWLLFNHPSIHPFSIPAYPILAACLFNYLTKDNSKSVSLWLLMWITSKCSRWKNLHQQPQSTCHKRTERQTSWPINHRLECKIQLAFKDLRKISETKEEKRQAFWCRHISKSNVSLNGWIIQWKAPFIRCLTQVLMCG